MHSQEYTLSNDALGDFAAHYFVGDVSIEISDLPDLILNKNNLAINEDRLLHYFAVTKPQDNAGFFEKIKQVNPGQYLTISNKKLRVFYFYVFVHKTSNPAIGRESTVPASTVLGVVKAPKKTTFPPDKLSIKAK